MATVLFYVGLLLAVICTYQSLTPGRMKWEVSLLPFYFFVAAVVAKHIGG